MLNLTTNVEHFRNSNGTTYRIAGKSQSGSYTFLISDVPNTLTPYVIAWGCRGYEGSWAQGHYYSTIENAIDDWNNNYQSR